MSPVLKGSAFPRGRDFDALRTRLLSHPNVTGCYVGRKRVGGKPTARLALIAIVREKVASSDISPTERIPTTLLWSPEGVGRTLHTDVQTLGTAGYHTAAVEPGDAIAPAATTAGIALHHPLYGDVITTAGHGFLSTSGEFVFSPGSEPVNQIRAVDDLGQPVVEQGYAVKAVLNDSEDYALLRGDAATIVRNRYGGIRLGGPHVPDASEIGTPLFALTANGSRPTRLAGVNADVQFNQLLGRHCLLTTWVTQDGDSGCVLADANGRVWGLLRGWAEIDGEMRSVWISVLWPLTHEHAQLI